MANSLLIAHAKLVKNNVQYVIIVTSPLKISFKLYCTCMNGLACFRFPTEVIQVQIQEFCQFLLSQQTPGEILRAASPPSFDRQQESFDCH